MKCPVCNGLNLIPIRKLQDGSVVVRDCRFCHGKGFPAAFTDQFKWFKCEFSRSKDGGMRVTLLSETWVVPPPPSEEHVARYWTHAGIALAGQISDRVLELTRFNMFKMTPERIRELRKNLGLNRTLKNRGPFGVETRWCVAIPQDGDDGGQA